MATVWGLLLSLDGAIYDMVCYVYEIFYGLAGMNIFGMSDYQEIVSRIYIILGLLMLFVLTYVLLRAIVNPDEFSKGDKSFPKIIQNLIVSLVIIAVLPTVFTLIFNVQNAFLNQDTIPRLILGNPETGMEVSEGDVSDEYDTSNVSGGKVMAYYAFKAFFAPNIEGEACQDANTTDEDECRKDIGNNDGWFFGAGQSNAEEDSLAVTDQMILYKDGSFTYYNAFSEAVRDHNMKYYFPISTVAGVFILYVLLNFCFDMALRVIKLAFYQIIAPIPVICRVIPIGNLKDVFSKWVKQVTSLFVEVFIRIAALSLGVYLLQILISKWNSKQIDFSFFTRTGQKTIVLALLIMAIVMFIKKIPGIIGDMFGLDTSGLKLGLMDKLAMGGGLFAGAVAGGAVTGFARNAIGNYQKSRSAGKGRFASVLSGAKSGIAGGASAGLHAGWAGRNAKNAKDMKSAVATGTSISAKNKATRDYYKAMPGSAIGHRFLDKVESIGEYFGVNSVQDLMDENKLIDKIASDKKAVRTSVESVLDGEANKSSSSFSYAGYSATELRQKMLNIQSARAGQLKDINGKIISAAQAQQEYDQYRYEFSQAMQNIVLSQSEFEKLGSVDSGMQAKMYEAYSQAEVLKDTLSKNLDKDYVKQAGFTAANVKGDLKVDTSGPLKDIGDILDVQKAKNNAEIARRTREKQEKDSK